MSGSAPERHSSGWGFVSGLICGTALMVIALVAAEQQAFPYAQAVTQTASVWSWITLNLGHSFWLFSLVLLLYAVNIGQLHRLLIVDPNSRRITQLDQLSDVWMHLFVGIGVIWTAVGMRSALQAALGDSPVAIVDSADAVLRKLVDGGILLALTTTIVGGIGGYLMRLVKTVLLGTRLQELFDRQQRSDVQALLEATQRIEARVLGKSSEPRENGSGDAVGGDSRALA